MPFLTHFSVKKDVKTQKIKCQKALWFLMKLRYEIYRLDSRLLEVLLLDRTTNKNLIWATDNYALRGLGYTIQQYKYREKRVCHWLIWRKLKNHYRIARNSVGQYRCNRHDRRLGAEGLPRESLGLRKVNCGNQ